MAGSVQQFWQMIVRSGLHDEADCRRFADAYFQAKEAGALAGQSLPEWLVAQKALTRYQAKILVAGRPGPFVFGEYVVQDRIEAGALAGQFRATHRGTGCPVCLRFISGPPAADAALLALLGDQAMASAALSSDTTRLGHCYALVDLGAYKFFVLEALAGESLAERLAKTKRAAPASAVRIIAQATAGLARLHRAQRAHGEISPSALWIDGNAAKLLSFPWSPDPLSPHGSGNTAAASYQPPEAAPQAAATPHGDIYALGCVLYQLLAGKASVQPADLATPLDKVVAGVTPELAALVARMLAKDPAERIAGAAELADELARHEGGADKRAAPSALRVALDAAIAAQRLQPSAAASVAISQSKPMAAAAAEIAVTPAGVATSNAKAPMVAVEQPAGVASLAGLVDHDEPSVAAKPRAIVASGETKKKNLPLIVAGASTAVVLVAAALLVLSRGLGGSAPSNPAQIPASKSVAAPVDVADAGANGGATSTEDPSADPKANSSPSPGSTPTSTGENETNGPGPKADDETPPGRGAEQLVGVGGEMWASPTAGQPLDLAYLPPGAEVIIALRAADLVRHPEAQRLLDSRTTGALGTWIQERLPALIGAPLDNIEQVLIALLATSEGPPRLALVARLKESPDEAELLKAWGNPQSKESDGEKYFQNGDTAYYLPSAGAGRTVVVAPAATLVEDVLPNGVNPPVLRRELEILQRSSDADRMLTLLVAPNILLTGGDEWLPGNAARARSPLDWFLAGEATDRAPAPTPSGKAPRRGPMTDLSSGGLPKGVLASAHLTEADLFFEVRLLADPNQPAKRLAEAYRERVARLPRKASDFLRTLAMSDYSRDVLFGFPLMVEQLSQFTLAGTEGRQVVLRTYLPVVAAHNLALAGHLAMLENPRAGGSGQPPQTAGGPNPSAGPSPAGQPPKAPMPETPASSDPTPDQTVAERLDRKISLSFERNTLEPTLQQIGQEIGVEIVILGADLQNDGITRNKAIDKFAERDLPAREILQKIMVKANPDGKLIYVIKPAENGEGEALYFTTRAAAAARGDKLPVEFEK